MRQKNAKNGYRAPAVDRLRLTAVARQAGVSPVTIGTIAGPGWSLPSIVELPDGSPGWIGAADVGAVRAWLSAIVAAGRRPSTRAPRKAPI